jgi:D-alanyl-D-alanine carboxypeptidase (penicillin-binding protein 5/6)
VPRLLFPFLTALVSLALAVPAAAFETRARSAYVYDQSTATVLMAKDADTPRPPASMSKLMTLYMLFDALRDGRVGMGTEFTVSSRAKDMKGSTMFLDERDRPTAEELIQGIIVSSGNDATVVVAEGLGGTEAAFSRQMNQMAAKLGMTNSNFTNASGWPDPDHRMSVRDLGILAQHLIEEFPEYYHYFAQREFDYKNRSPANRFNRNPLLGLGIGADGLKTGHTTEAGYGLVGSAQQGDRRVIFVISGLDKAEYRAEEAEALVNWSFRQFTPKTVARTGQAVAEAEVWMGSERSVGMVPAEDITVPVPALTGNPIIAEVVYHSPVMAPVRQGQTLGELVLRLDGLPEIRRPLLAASNIPEGGFMVRVTAAANSLLARLVAGPEGAM